jgi:hypothetical protein
VAQPGDVSDLRSFLDRAQIQDCVHRYARGMDRLDRELVRSAYHDDAYEDHGGFVGPLDEFLDWSLDFQSRYARHQHYVTNHSAELDGDTAHAETYFLFVGTERDPDAPLTTFGGRYIDRFERRQGRWAIAVRVLLVEWRTSLACDLSPAAFAFMAGAGTVARDRQDLSYARPLQLQRTSLTA